MKSSLLKNYNAFLKQDIMLLSEAAKDLGIYLDDLEVVENKKVTLEVSW
jgi:hypothetical protein